MKKLFSLLSVIAFIVITSQASFAQITVTASAGTIGPTNYATLKLAFDAVNAGTHQGAITISITANTNEGTTPATLNSSGAGSANYTSVLIQPTTDGVSISGNPVTGFGVIQLNGADNVTINGDNPNTLGTNRNLTVSNTTTATVIANSVIRIATSAAVTSADNNTIRNCILNGNVTGGNSSSITVTTGSSNSSFGIFCGGNGGATTTGAPIAITSVTSNTAPSGTTINALIIDNNAINQCARGIVFNGAATTVSNGVTISNNLVGDQGSVTGTPPYTSPATTVYTKGIWIAGTSSISISGNSVKNIMSYVGTTITGVELVSSIGSLISISNNFLTNIVNNGTGSIVKALLISNGSGAYSISGNTITNVQALAGLSGTDALEVTSAGTNGIIELNKITTVYNRNVGTFGAYGINLTTGTGIIVRNNFVSDINMNMSGGSAFSASFGVFGIRIAGGTNHKVYYNSVNMNAALLGTATTTILSSALNISATTITGVDVRNNIFSNTMTGGTTSIAHVSLYLPAGPTSAMNLTLNNNAYFSGTDVSRQGIAQVGLTAGSGFYLAANFNPGTITPAANLRALTSTLSAVGTNDNASFATTDAAPFISSTDLHINTLIATGLESGGTPISGTTTDIDGDTRNLTTPDIGADEGNFTPLAGMTYVSSTSTQNNTSTIGLGTTNAEIIGVQIVTSGSLTPLSLTSINLNTNGSSNPPGDITNAKVWYTGTSSTFTATTQFGTTFSGPNGAFTVNGSQTLSAGTNYFWVTYDVSNSGSPGNFLDAECNSLTGSGTMGSQVPSIQAPAGSRMIVGPLSGTYTIGVFAFNSITGRNIEKVKMTRMVKKLIPIENAAIEIGNKEERRPIELNATNKSYAENISYKEVEVTEDYYELQENGVKYTGALYAKNENRSNGNINDGIGDYATIEAAISDLNTRGVNGAVTFLLLDNSYSVTGSLQFNNNISGISSSNNVTLRPGNGIISTITGSINSNAVFRILSSYVTIDGSNSGSNDRSLTIQNNSATSPNVILMGSTGTIPITNVTLENCVITNGANTSSAVVVSDATTIGNAGYFNTVTIQNNKIEKAYIGLYATGGSATANGFNLVVSNNTLTSSGTSSIRLTGLYAQYVNGATISSNVISNIANTVDAANMTGIWSAAGTTNCTISGNTIGTFSNTASSSTFIQSGIIVSPAVTNANVNINGNNISNITSSSTATTSGITLSGASDGITIQRNTISNIKNTNTTGYGANGIFLNSSNTSGTNTVQNNMIFDIAGYGYASGTAVSDNGYGIISILGTGYKIYNNTVLMNTNQTVNGLPAAINITSGVTTANGIDVRNNIFANTQTVGTNRYAFYSGAVSTVYSNINYNCYYSGGPNIGNIGATDRAAIINWRTGTGKDVQSFSILPVFLSSTNLRVQPYDLSVSGRGNYISTVNNDIDNDSRSTTQSAALRPVDVGCDQFTPSLYTGNVCVYNGTNAYFDAGLKSVEITSGTLGGFTATIREYTGVKTTNNSMFKNQHNPDKQDNHDIRKNSDKNNTEPLNKNDRKKNGTSGGVKDVAAVNTPWVYWEIDNIPISASATLRFYYNDDQLATILESDLKISFWNGTAWDDSFTQSIDATNNFISLTLPTGAGWPSTSLFAIEDQGAPLPVVLSSFDAAVNRRDVNLNWVTESEINNKGFAVERRLKTTEGQFTQWKEISFVDGRGNSNSNVSYSFSDKKLNSGAYQYRLKQLDFNGNYEYHSPANNSDLVVGKPGSFDVSQNYPNPSNPKSKIDFQMPFDGKVSIKVYDVIGREVATLINDFKPADFYTVEFDGSNVSSGIYFYRITAEGDNRIFTKTMKMILVK
ncbi:MAG: T9SS type A sorting domain-containing protein [Ignavibacteria bacterium]